MKNFLYSLLAFLMVSLNTITTDAQYKIINYTDMNQINSLTEDGDYIWVCSSGGAFKRKKSDGSLVKVFNIENSGISRNGIEDLYIDIHGNYWFGTYNGGISMYDGTKWTNIDKINGENIYTISKITEDLSGNLWFGERGRAFKFDGTNWTKYVFAVNNPVESIVPDDNGNIWFGLIGYKGGFWKMDAEGLFTRIPGPGNKFIDDDGPYDLMKDSYGNLWIAYYGGAYKFNPQSDTWTDYGSQAGFNVYAITQDNKGMIWFGTANGVIRYDGASFTNFTSGRSMERGNMALDVLADAQGNVWIGGYIGYAKVDETNNTWTTPIMLNSLPTNFVETLEFDSNKKAWIFGQFSNCITFDGTYWKEVINNSSAPDGWVIHSAIDNSNNKWITTLMGPAYNQLGLIKIDNSGNYTPYIISGPLTFQWASGFVYDIEYDPVAGKIWIATQQGMFWFKISNNTFGQYRKSNSSIAGDTIQGLAINGSKVWYSAFRKGIGYFDQSNNTWKNYTTADGLPSNSAGQMVFDPSGNLWFLCSGLTKWDGNSFQNWYPPNNSSSCIACDHDGNIWTGGSRLSKFRDGEFKLYSIDNGLIENTVRNIVVDPDNNIWLATQQYGLSKMIPQLPVAEFSASTVCLPGTTYLSDLSTKTDNLSKYQWDINNDGSIEYTSKDIEHVFAAKGDYVVRLKVLNDALSSEIVHNVKVLEAPDLSLNLEGNHFICSGNSQEVDLIINNPDSQLSYQVNWNNGMQGTTQIWAHEEGEYFAEVNNGECESQSPSLNLSVSQPFSEEKICMVTVDIESGKNLVVWERTADAGIESYVVYRLYGNIYSPIGNVSALETSQFIDYLSTPEALAARYAISAIDTCGNESEKSAFHQTIHLGAALGIQPNTVVLDWTNYLDESGTWQPEWYYIYRGNDPSNLVLLDSVSSVFTEWNDMNPGGNKYYQVLVKKSNPCSPALLNTKKASSGPYIHSLSNLEDNRLQATGLNDPETVNSIRIFPNPLKNESKISWNNPDGNSYNLFLYDLRGTMIRSENELNNDEFTLKKENLTPGCYILELRGKNTYRGRLIVE